MNQRIIETTDEFEKELKRLGKKHKGLVSKVEALLDGLAMDRQPDRHPLSGLDDLPIFKTRCGTENLGKRKGARILYYRDDLRLFALYIYFKNEKEIIPVKDIRKSLKRHGIL